MGVYNIIDLRLVPKWVLLPLVGNQQLLAVGGKMNRFGGILVGSLSLALIACAPSKNPSAQSSLASQESDSIINGQPIEVGSELLQSVVAIYDAATGQLCTGSLLPNNIILTAAHCIGPIPEAMYIVFGTELNSQAQIRRAHSIKVSEYWETRRNSMLDTGDIALIHFKGSVPQGYKPATLLPSQKILRPGTQTVLVGFGYNDGVNKSGAGQVRHTTVKIADPNYSMTEVKLDQTQGTGACHGDSGGPAYVKIGSRYYLWGITSRGVDDANDDCSKYSAFTNALAYRAWISRNASKLSEGLTQIKSQ